MALHITCDRCKKEIAEVFNIQFGSDDRGDYCRSCFDIIENSSHIYYNCARCGEPYAPSAAGLCPDCVRHIDDTTKATKDGIKDLQERLAREGIEAQYFPGGTEKFLCVRPGESAKQWERAQDLIGQCSNAMKFSKATCTYGKTIHVYPKEDE